MTHFPDILDLKRFPLDAPESDTWTDLVARCRDDLAKEGMFNLDGFLHPSGAATIADELTPLFAGESFQHERSHNIYFKRGIDGLAPDHPALTQFQTSNYTLCADQFLESPLISLYEWPHFARFLAAVMGKPQLHPMSDPLARVNCMAYYEGQALNWHFDRSEFTTTLLLQAPQEGGEFEYRTGLRSDTDPNYEGVGAMLRGEDKNVSRLVLTPGTLNVFKGRNTAHRVTPVRGNTARMISVFSYYEKPGVMFSDAERIGFYGRAN